MILPEPSSSMQQHSLELQDKIAASIREKGFITFADYMQQVLYTPGLGYYSGGSRKFGREGDFITAPEISPLFSYTLAHYIQQNTAALPYSILELGAGTGTMAAHILLRLQQLDHLPQQYCILDVSADLRERQAETIKNICPDLFNHVIWLDHLPQAFTGVILANEVIDAMPVHLFHWQDHILYERYVTISNNQFSWLNEQPSTPLLSNYLANYIADLPNDYISEVNLTMLSWLRSIAACLKQGEILLIDYGFQDPAFYHPQRTRGTLMCHYQHHAHPDPFYWPGLQDITSHVHFTGLMQVAMECGLSCVDYTTQANFLIHYGLLALAENHSEFTSYPTAQALKQLLLPQEMGELFKVLHLSKKI